MKVLVNRAIDRGEFRNLAYELSSRLWSAATAYPPEKGGLPTLSEAGIEVAEQDMHIMCVPTEGDLLALVTAMLEDVDTVFQDPADMHYIWTVTSDEEPGVAYVSDTERSARRWAERTLGREALEAQQLKWEKLGDHMLRLGVFVVERCVVSYGIL